MIRHALESWDAQLNSKTDKTSVARYSDQQYYFERECSKHYAYTSPNALCKDKKNKKKALWCKYCTSRKKGRKPSKWEKKGMDVITEAVATQPHIKVMTEARVLGDRFGPTDITLVSTTHPGLQLHVEIDGEQHVTKGCKTKTLIDQHDADSRKDEAMWKKKQCLVRLHYEDRIWWPQKLKYALDLLLLKKSNNFILYTSSYKKQDIVKKNI